MNKLGSVKNTTPAQKKPVKDGELPSSNEPYGGRPSSEMKDPKDSVTLSSKAVGSGKKMGEMPGMDEPY